MAFIKTTSANLSTTIFCCSAFFGEKVELNQKELILKQENGCRHLSEVILKTLNNVHLDVLSILHIETLVYQIPFV